MTMTEKMINRINNDIAKAQKGIERHTQRNIKKEAKCVELNCLWRTWDEFYQHRDTDMTQEQYAAWTDWHMNQNSIEEYQKNLARAMKELDKVMGKYETEQEVAAENAKIDSIESAWGKWSKETPEERKARYEAWLKQFKEDCAKDGIIIKEADANFINGFAKSGEKFVMYINNGWSERSLNSYTLRIAGEVVFTSGLFSTGYRYLMK